MSFDIYIFKFKPSFAKPLNDQLVFFQSAILVPSQKEYVIGFD